MLVISATHFGSSYHLAYADGREAVRRNPFALAVLPLLLLLVSGAAVAASSGSPVTARWMVRVLIGIVFTMTGWHYVKQAFGVVMLMMKTHGFSVERREIAALRYGLYPLWFLNLARTWVPATPPVVSATGLDWSCFLRGWRPCAKRLRRQRYSAWHCFQPNRPPGGPTAAIHPLCALRARSALVPVAAFDACRDRDGHQQPCVAVPAVCSQG